MDIYGLLKARFLVDKNAAKNWFLIVFVIGWCIVLIANSHRYEQKVFKIWELNKEVKELRSEFVDRKSELMKLKMESTVSAKMEKIGVVPSDVPPVKIQVIDEEAELSWWQKLWK